MRVFLQTICFMMVSSLALGQLWSDPITGTNPNINSPFNSLSGTTVASALSVYGITRAVGLTGIDGNDVYRANGWSADDNINLAHYFEFTLSLPVVGRHISFSNFQFTSAGSSSSGDGGPTQFAVRSSIDNFGSNITTFTRASASADPINTTVDLSAAAFQNVTNQISFRVYGWDAENSSGHYEIRDFIFNGTIPVVAGSLWQENITGTVNSSTAWVNNLTGAVDNADRFLTTDIVVSGLSRGGANAPAALTTSNAYRANNWTTSNTINTDQYFQLTVAPSPGHKINLLAFYFTSARSYPVVTDGGPGTFAVRSSLDNYSTNLVEFSFLNGNPLPATTFMDFSGNGFQNLTAPVTFRIYAWGAENANGYFEIRDFSFTGAVALPVIFGNVEAIRKTDGLNIKWSTEEETNNDYFEVQASKDGVDFKTVKVVQSTDGDSDVKQDYEVTITEADVAALLAIPAVLGLLSFGFSRRTRLIGFVATLMLLAVNFVACNKNSDGIDAGGVDKVFIRIKQVDVNGDAKYSKVIQVVNN